MGQEIETLADLIPDTPRAICVGINPAPPSVTAGHYFQGRQGQRFYARLRRAGLLPSTTTPLKTMQLSRSGSASPTS